MHARSAFDIFEDGDAVSNATGLECKDVSLTHQESVEETDINRIVETWVRTGIAPVNPIKALSGDFSDAVDYRTSLDRLRVAQTEFNGLDANVRSYFANDPANLIDFLNNENNRTKAEELGLVLTADKPKIAPVEPQGLA